MSPMMEFYPQVKWTHVHAVMCSGAIFALRGGAYKREVYERD